MRYHPGTVAQVWFLCSGLTLSDSAGLRWLSTFKMPVKCRLHRCSFPSLVVQGCPSSSLMLPVLCGIGPLQACCMSRMALHTFFPQNLPTCASSAFLLNHVSLASLTALRASHQAFRNFRCSLIRPLSSHLVCNRFLLWKNSSRNPALSWNQSS